MIKIVFIFNIIRFVNYTKILYILDVSNHSPSKIKNATVIGTIKNL